MSQGFDWSQFDPSGGYGPGYGDNPFPDQPTSTYGMGDRGLGTTDPNSPDGTLTPAQIANLSMGSSGIPGSGGLPGGAGGNPLGGLASLFSGQNLPLLLGMLGPALGGLLNAHATNQATGQVTAGIGNAQNAVSKLLGTSAFSPYIQAGQGALGRASGMQWQPLNFAPLSGRTLGSLASKKG